MLEKEVASNCTGYVAVSLLLDHTHTPSSASIIRVVEMNLSRGSVMISNPKPRPDEVKREFTFDAVYDWK